MTWKQLYFILVFELLLKVSSYVLLSATGDAALNTLGSQDIPRLITNLAVQAESITTLPVLLVDMFLHQKPRQSALHG
jgi:hypothetical protein